MTQLVYIERMELRGGMNSRDAHWGRRHKRVAEERDLVSWALVGKPKPATPCRIQIVRIAPSNGLDDDNLASACKGVRDALAQWMGVDDRRRDLVRYSYDQLRGPWGVRIDILDTE